jgi:gluconate 2-dehydrogenase gamma chain
MTFISRRDLLKRAAVVGAAAVPANVGRPFQGRHDEADGAPERLTLHEPALHAHEMAAAREPLENLTAAEADLLDAIVARLIPTDTNGPGATEARAVHYIDRALGGALASSRQVYTAGLAALDRYSRSSRGKGFTELSATDQDSVLIDVETGAATGFPERSSVFFALVLNHTQQGTFGDPYYGGNANFVGWDLIGYPGIRTMVTAAEQQRLEKKDLKPNHKSAYDYGTFTKASARVGSREEMKHGD